jgi:hypothetical protein
MAENPPSEMKLVWDLPDDALCIVCKKHRSAMVEAQSPYFGRIYFCKLCARDILTALEDEEGENDG